MIKYLKFKFWNLISKYLLINEYYNPKPVSIDYRGHSERLYKRDFAGEILDIDGVTGGFNFQHCWTSGWIAGKSIF